MKHLFLVRHGDYGTDGSLNSDGRAQIESLAARMKPIINPRNVHVVTSPSQRTIETSAILTSRLILPHYEISQYLTRAEGSENFYFDLAHGSDRTMDFIEARPPIDTTIAVTHADVALLMFSDIVERKFGIHKRLRDLGLGQAIYFDLEAKSYDILSN
jgi:hypothetical protein